jgi:hypothetical protein
MRPGIILTVSRADRRRLEALAGNRNAAQKHVWRARIVLLSAAGVGTNEIMRQTGKSKTCVVLGRTQPDGARKVCPSLARQMIDQA